MIKSLAIVIKSISRPFPLPRRLGDRAKSSDPLITRLVPWQPAPILRGFPKSHLININLGVGERGLLFITKDIHFTFITLELFQEMGET